MTAEHFDAVIVGSGFGGSVMTYRLVEGGFKRVLLLERGKSYPPGSFARSPEAMKKNFWDPGEGQHGLFQTWSFEHMDGIVSSGLGGGSLIYANVMLRKDPKWFVHEDLQNGGHENWPVTREDLDPHYDRVEKMLDAQEYPFKKEPYSRTGKTLAFREAAASMGAKFMLPNLAVTFSSRPGAEPIPGEPIEEHHRNLHDRTRNTCRLCGECDIGCNYGSKNTLDYTYLSEAKRLGAEIRTRCEVKSFRPQDPSGFAIEYVEHLPESEGRKTNTAALPRVTVTTDRLILSAGTFGTNHLLLSNKDNLRKISPQLGHRFSGNGDLLTFAVRARSKVDGQLQPRSIDASVGPVITCAIRVPDLLDGDGGTGRGFYVQDAGFPAFVGWMAQLAPSFGKLAQLVLRGLKHETEIDNEIEFILGDTAVSGSSLPLLSMGRDVPGGKFTLQKNGDLQLDWKREESSALFEDMIGFTRKMATVWNASFHLNPTFLLNRLITVHPLGGCSMARDPSEGVTGVDGQVFGYPGLYVCDGAALPGPVGANPSLTIAANADRIAEGILEGAGRALTRT
jgi:cholesterol oxidase